MGHVQLTGRGKHISDARQIAEKNRYKAMQRFRYMGKDETDGRQGGRTKQAKR